MQSAFLEALESEGFDVLIFKGFDPVLLQHGLNSPIPLHYVISHSGNLMHVLVLYERPGKFWWAGGYTLSNKELIKLHEFGMKKEDLYMIILSAAFDKYAYSIFNFVCIYSKV